MNIYKIRRLRTNQDGTFGNFCIDDDMVCVTAELPWDDNLPNKSCVPTGTFTFEAFSSPVHGATWKATNIPGRSNIEIHTGNIPLKESLGCIIVGENFGELDGKPAVLNSKMALRQLRALLPPTFMIQFEWVN